MTPNPTPELAEGERLQKVLARAGFGSRRVCEDLIEDGRVTVDGEVAVLGRRVDPATAEVEVDGVLVGVAPDLVHWLLHKPAGVVTTAVDPQGRTDRARPRARRAPGLPRRPPRLRHRGPAAPDQRRRPDPPPDPPVLRRREGVPGRGRPACRRGATCAACGRASSWTTASRRRPRWPRSTTGRCASPSTRAATARSGAWSRPWAAPVLRLVRTRIGPLTDRVLKPGEWRPLTQDEVRALERAAVEGTDSEAGTEPHRYDPGDATAGPPGRHHDRRRRGRAPHDPHGRSCSRSSSSATTSTTTTWSASSSRPPTTSGARSRPPRPGRFGLGDVPLICARELDVEGATPAVRPGDAPPRDRPGPGRAPPRLPARSRATSVTTCPVEPPRKATLVGTGLIGGSIGLALRRAGWTVVGTDRDPERAEAAVARRARSTRSARIPTST